MEKNNSEKKVIVFPATLQFAKNYGGYEGLEIWLKENSLEAKVKADCFIGHSTGASLALTYFASNPESKFILFNPLIKKRNLFNLTLHWIKFCFSEGIPWKKTVPLGNWISGFGKIWELLKIDVVTEIKKIPKENLVVIRGKKDRFFCDEECADIIKKSGIGLIEVDAGHDWNENVKNAIDKVASY